MPAVMKITLPRRRSVPVWPASSVEMSGTTRPAKYSFSRVIDIAGVVSPAASFSENCPTGCGAPHGERYCVARRRFQMRLRTLLCHLQHIHKVGWFRDWIAVLAHGTKVHFHRAAHQLTRLFQRAASRHAAREIRHVGAVACAGGVKLYSIVHSKQSVRLFRSPPRR